MPEVDLSIFSRQKSLLDYQQLQQEFELKKQLAKAELAKANFLDVDKLGEQSIYKAAMGLPLSPQEQAAARFADAKSGGIQFDPVTGGMMQKPSILSKLGITLGGATTPDSSPNPVIAPPSGGGYMPPPTSGGAPDPNLGGDPILASLDPNNQWDNDFAKRYQAAGDNPRLKQSLATNYLESKYKMTDEQGKAAGFANRAMVDQGTVNNPNISKEMASFWQKQLARVPGVGNALNSEDYQSGIQAQRDFINAVLRRESGAAINEDEFANARLQYLPQYGDKPDVLARKKANRELQIRNLQMSAGPSYKAPAAIDGTAPAVDIQGYAPENETLQSNIAIPQKPNSSGFKYLGRVK